jgi:hypothetical protein
MGKKKCEHSVRKVINPSLYIALKNINLIMSALTQSTLLGAKVVVSKAAVAKRTNVVTRAGQYDDELLQTAVSFFFLFFYAYAVCVLLPLK